MRIWLADLTYTQQMIASDFVPAAIGMIAEYLENKMPDVMKNTLPDFTGPSIEIPKKKVSPLGNTQN